MNSDRKTKKYLMEWCDSHIGAIVRYDAENKCIRAHWDLARVYYRVVMPSVIVTYQISFASNIVNGFLYTNSTCEEKNNAFAAVLEKAIPNVSFVSDTFTNMMGQIAFSFDEINNITYDNVTSGINSFEKKIVEICMRQMPY